MLETSLLCRSLCFYQLVCFLQQQHKDFESSARSDKGSKIVYIAPFIFDMCLSLTDD